MIQGIKKRFQKIINIRLVQVGFSFHGLLLGFWPAFWHLQAKDYMRAFNWNINAKQNTLFFESMISGNFRPFFRASFPFVALSLARLWCWPDRISFEDGGGISVIHAQTASQQKPPIAIRFKNKTKPAWRASEGQSGFMAGFLKLSKAALQTWREYKQAELDHQTLQQTNHLSWIANKHSGASFQIAWPDFHAKPACSSLVHFFQAILSMASNFEYQLQSWCEFYRWKKYLQSCLHCANILAVQQKEGSIQ